MIDQTESGWTRLAEAQPSASGFVWLACEGGPVGLGLWDQDAVNIDTGDPRPQLTWLEPAVRRVQYTHWMPAEKPAPPVAVIAAGLRA